MSGVTPAQMAGRIMAMFRGGALGDAMGAAIEFLDLTSIRRIFPDRVDRILPHQGIIGAITDDTQMTLFTAEGLIRAGVRSTLRGICHPPSVIHHAYLRWLITQRVLPRITLDADDVGLFRDLRLQVRRAPGNTCLEALASARHFGQAARNNSKGCGGVMRLAPMLLAPSWALQTSALTHGHPTAADAAMVWIEILFAALAGKDLRETATSALTAVGPEMARALQVALDLPPDGRPETIERIGGGWIAEEAVAIALYAVLHAKSFDEGLQMALIHSGDSDSTAAMAGNLLGLLFTDEVMKHPLMPFVECGDLIDRLARDLVTVHTTNIAEDPDFVARYPGV
jgi:ADP-ribosyl-[dinitrogen reductase] hydrolase